jgi:hypothetical protein
MFRRRRKPALPQSQPKPEWIVPIGQWAWAHNEIRDKLLPMVEADLVEGTNEERVLLALPSVVRLRACADEIEGAVARELEARGHSEYVARTRRNVEEDVVNIGRHFREG